MPLTRRGACEAQACGDLSPQERGEVLGSASSCGSRARVPSEECRRQHLAPLLRGEVAKRRLPTRRRVRGAPTRIHNPLLNRVIAGFSSLRARMPTLDPSFDLNPAWWMLAC